MADKKKMGRPKMKDPTEHVVSVKFKESDYLLMVEYAKNHNMSISQMIRYGIEMQLKASQK